MLVGYGEAGTELPGDFYRFVLRKSTNAAQQIREVFPIHVLHADEGHAVGFANIEYPADVRMRDVARDTYFAMEPRQGSAVLHQLFRQELEGNVLIKLKVLGAINLSHSSPAYKRNDAIAVGQYRSGKYASTFSTQ